MRFAVVLVVGLVSGCVNITTADVAGPYLNVMDQNHAFRFQVTYPDAETCALASAVLSQSGTDAPSYCSKNSRPNTPWYTYADSQNTRFFYRYQSFTDCMKELEFLKKDPLLKISTACKTS